MAAVWSSILERARDRLIDNVEELDLSDPWDQFRRPRILLLATDRSRSSRHLQVPAPCLPQGVVRHTVGSTVAVFAVKTNLIPLRPLNTVGLQEIRFMEEVLIIRKTGLPVPIVSEERFICRLPSYTKLHLGHPNLPLRFPVLDPLDQAIHRSTQATTPEALTWLLNSPLQHISSEVSPTENCPHPISYLHHSTPQVFMVRPHSYPSLIARKALLQQVSSFSTSCLIDRRPHRLDGKESEESLLPSPI